MKSILKDKKKIFIAFAIVLVIALLSTLIAKHVDNKYAKLDSETRRAMTYEQIEERGNYVNYINSDGTTGNECKFIEFSAFFTRDLNGDGYAERLKGTCKDLSATDTLYAEVNVLTKGHLEKGQITLNANNFKWKTAIVADNIVEGDYIGEISNIRLKEQVPSGSQKLLWGTISPNIGNNVNNYSKINSMTLTGTYVDDEGNRTDIRKTVDLTVDWYETTNTVVNKYYYSDSKYTSYDKQSLDISTAVKEDNVELNFKVAISETNKTLLLQKQVAELTIPEINGYKPTEVLVLDKNVEYNYDEGTSKLIITRNSTVDENGNVISQISRSNVNNVKIVYPLEAYDNITVDSMILNIHVVGYNHGYNNLNDEFQNPYISKSEGILTVTYGKISGSIWNAYATVGDYERTSSDIDYYRYVVSKEAITNIYNGNVYEDEKTIYPVRWQVGVANFTAISKITLEELEDNGQHRSDRFLNTQNKYISMYDYIKTTGIYFVNAQKLLGNNGWIKLYNAETGSLIETFTSNNWSNFSKDKPYVVDMKSIKIETSNPVENTIFNVYQIKEIDDELISKEFSKEEFERLFYIYTYMHAKIEVPDGLTYEGGQTTSEIVSTYYAYYEVPYSVSKIKVTPDQITNQRTENVDFVIDVLSQNSMERKWKNGIFLIELPEDIINVDIKDISISDEKVEISSCEVVQGNGKSFIKIYTLNEEESLYKITINADVTANPLKPTSAQDVKLYSYNENGDNYANKIEDKFDIDADGKTSDYIGLSSTVMSFVAPSGLLTTEYVTNYDDLNSTTIAPNVADIEKSDEARTATINVSITNGYSGTISDIVLLGKIPFEGNTYILNEGSLNSQYTANITGEINIPEKIKQNTVIYYSSNENPSKDLKDESNGWKLAEDVTDWNEIKTYLIDLSGYSLEKGENEVFTYEVEVPGGLGYNTASYSDHAVYYSLDTEDGKLKTQTEPNKVGIQVVSKYGLQLTKNKKANDTTFVKGATYSITTTDNEENTITKTATTDQNGVLKFSGIYVEREYTLKEVASPSDYMINTEKVKFKAQINEDGELEFKVLEGSFKEEPQLTIDKNGNYLVNAKVEDEAKYTLVINKTDENGNSLKDVRFRLTGRVLVKNYTTDKNGVVTIGGLNLNEEYKLQEREAEGYYIDSEARGFKIIRNESGALEIVTDDETLKNVVIKEEQGVAQAVVTVDIQNEKIPTYNLRILKVEAESDDADEENERALKPLTGASFKLISIDIGSQKEYTVDEDGYINITDLYEYVEGKNITGKYILKETKAPDGYTNNAEEINFRATRNEEGNLEVNVENEEKLSTFKSATIEGNTLTLVIEDEPLFKITKIDSETGERLANVDFVIYELDENNIVLDFAKDVNGNYVGEKNQYDEYIVTTDENGVISLPLRPGSYRIVEVGFPDGYYEYSTIETFKVNRGVVEESEGQEERGVLKEIYYIEDLVELSNNVNNGNKYENVNVKLMRTLDFQEDDSYNPDDSHRAQLKKQLTSGAGFAPIGRSTNYFSGVFDGQAFEIRNLYINFESSSNSYEYVGLFGYVYNGVVKNLGVTGSISASSEKSCYVGGLVAYLGGYGISRITNCYSSVDVSGSGSTGFVDTGGIAGYSSSSSISNCYNTGAISSSSSNGSSYAGGVAGYSTSSGIISNCYNTGAISSSNSSNGSSYAGGIAGYSTGGISNCYYLDSIVITGKTIGNYGEAKPEADMKEQEEFVSVLGASYWSIDIKNINNGYPILDCKVNKIREIKYIEDLVELSNQVNAGEDYSGIAVKLMNDLNFEDEKSYNSQNENRENLKSQLISGSGFFPIGNSASICFSGVFDGQGYEIRNLHVNSELSSAAYVGLFGYVGNGVVKNLGVTGKIHLSSKDSYVGGIAGYSIGSISNCYNAGDISNNSSNSSYVGGIVGYSSGDISNCYNAGDISSSSSNGSSYAGGVAGYSTSSGIISNCYNTGAISSSNSSNGSSYAGGIAGNSSSSNISNCYYSDTIVITGKTIGNYGEVKPEADMKVPEFVSVLGASYWSVDVKNINNGYPILDCKVNKIKEIKYIEDLVELSNQVNAGVDYSGIEIKLMNDLNFDDYRSYRNSSDTSYGDLNGNGNKQEGIKNELTNKADGCCGFTPIGNRNQVFFSGTFDGQGHEIQNIYVKKVLNNGTAVAGLFGSVKNGKIINLGVTGKINCSSGGRICIFRRNSWSVK